MAIIGGNRVLGLHAVQLVGVSDISADCLCRILVVGAASEVAEPVCCRSQLRVLRLVGLAVPDSDSLYFALVVRFWAS